MSERGQHEAPRHRLPLRWKAAGALLGTTLAVAAVTELWTERESQALAPRTLERPALPLAGLPRDAGLLRERAARTLVIRSAPNLASEETPERLARRLAGRGVESVWVQFKQDESHEVRGGDVFYPSRIAPVAAGFADGRLPRFVEALEREGVAVSAWVPAFQDAAAWDAHPDWRAQRIDREGRLVEQPGWLCPRHPGAVAYQASILAEIARLFPGRLRGLYTDFIRFDDDLSCACPRCLGALARRRGVASISTRALAAAARENGPLWEDWVSLRSDAIRDALDAMRDALEDAAPDVWFGASVLPFSAEDYALNTQSGQDLAKMSRAGVDEIVLMGYWDDWEKSPAWLAESVSNARALVEGDAALSCLLDADMSVRRTMKTLEALDGAGVELGWFHYGRWSDEVLTTLQRAGDRLRELGGVPRADFTAVTIRVDTEPDAERSYERVSAEMIARLLDLFREEGVAATFVTVGRLAERQTRVLRRAVAEGHEIAGHGYDHEQIDALEEADQVAVVDRTLSSLRALGFEPRGFGAPRNSMTERARDRLIERGLFYDGSAAYDPLHSYLDPLVIRHSRDPGTGLVLLPFVMPNDWDARFLAGLSAAQTLRAWRERLERVAASGESTFVLDVHQWIASRPDDLEALRAFVRSAKGCASCRVLTLHDAARHALREIRRAEGDPEPTP